MKLKVSNSNAPVWRNLTVKSELPGGLKKLEELGVKENYVAWEGSCVIYPD